MIKNYMEDVVENILPSLLPKYENVCKCEKCIEDIKAIALNNLKPLYFVSDKGNVYRKIDELEIQFKTDAVNELTKAFEIVTKNPQHN